MKPDKPPPPKRDRDILRARNTRSLKTTNQTTSSISVSSPTESEVSGDGTELQPTPSSSSAATVPLDESESGTSSSSSGASSSTSEKDKGAEMKVYLDKLRELVPYVPRSGKISRVQLIHSAIDYITDLQESLEARARRKLRDKQDQASRPPLAALSQARVETNNRMTPLAENSSNRQSAPSDTSTVHSSLITSLPTLSSSEMNIISANISSGASGSLNSSSSTPSLPASPGPPPPQEPS